MAPNEPDAASAEAELLGAAHAALSSRYQQLVLLNRISLEMFSGQPFLKALSGACNVILGLTGARYVSVHFTDDAGKPFCAQWHGDRKLHVPEALARRDSAVSDALAIRGLRLLQETPGWAAAPFTADKGRMPDVDGAVCLGFEGPPPADPGRARLLAEIGPILRNARALERDLERRAALERMKSEVVALVSHELRTPLMAIQGFAELALECTPEELPPEKREEHMKIIVDESRRLTRLVSNFLDLSKLEAGGAALDRKAVDLTAMGRKLAALLKDKGRAELVVEVAPDAGTAFADEDQLYRALVNLCANAVKYTPPEGKITVRAKRLGGGVELSVKDEGPGLDPESAARLFQRFARGADAVSRKERGTGLGLAITKAIVEAHGGRIDVESQPGKGCLFRFTIPDKA